MSRYGFLGVLGCLALAVPAFASPSKSSPSASSPPPAVAVETALVGTSRLDRSIEAVGSLVSNESVVISPEIAGRIVGIHFEEGTAVKKGDVLFDLDDSIYKAQMSQAKAALSLSQANHRRSQELFEKKISAVQAVDETLARRNTDSAAVELAQAQLDKATIRAPFDGIVGLRQISVGDYVTPGQTLVNLESIDPLKVNFKVAEIYLSSIKPGQTINATVDAFPGRAFTGEVYAIDPLIDTAGRTVSLRGRLPNADLLLRPGLFARVKLLIESKPAALMIAEQALVPQGNEQFVYKVEGDKAVLIKVVTGQRKAGQVEVTDGLKAGDTIVVAGQMKLRPGASIKAVPASGAKAPDAKPPESGDSRK